MDGAAVSADARRRLRDRTVGMVGMGRIGRAIARRLDGFGVPVVYHSRSPQAGVSYQHYPKLIDMARDVDTLLLITPGGPSTRHLVNAEVLDALGPERHRHQHVARHGGRRAGADQGAEGARTSMPPASTCSSTSRRCRRSYLDWTMSCCSRISARPRSHTRQKMEQLVVDNLLAWAAGKPPLTPVPETPWPPKKRPREAGVIICPHDPSRRACARPC